MELKKLPYNDPKIPPNKTIGIRIRYFDGKILPLIRYPINPEIELTKINKAETAAVCFKVPHFNKTIIGLRIIPPPIPISPDTKPIIKPIINDNFLLFFLKERFSSVLINKILKTAIIKNNPNIIL